MSVPFIRLIGSSNLQQVCKDPQKTSERKAVLVSEDVINTNRIQLTQGVRVEEEESPVTAIPGRVYPRFQSAAKVARESVEGHRSDSIIPFPSTPAHTMKRPRDEYDDPITSPHRPLKVLKAKVNATVVQSRPEFKVPSAVGPRAVSSSTVTGTGVKERTVFYGNMPKGEPKPRVEEPDVDLETDERNYDNIACARLRRSCKLSSWS